ncbi:protein ANTAGONIST OF LIKE HETEROCHROMATIN PROTEIN 1-like isoform X1 [Salvia splendens]|uniref:protein ANTAGONIST OF LIKE HETEROCHROMATIN PROTEIN 1-like isoform X1 n=1 Tax=Salvia splendens TaxID=180675 RepID=UPI001C25CA77|nr:protein ANTAGONIST OF LIKE HETEROCHROMATIN PROTEIN 1-like isoform X1 [Salvia splendens]XP_042046778.1 protein ANTAGONIST OF LIKE HETEROCHROMATIN PROTEIN 1-like isoform X1 [Salvia splendens]XP_042046779.1 protein ANTAGONIST OF LIKE HETEROCHROMATIN PROTEIN 1-like isoform X1 [Salvia splendens]
MSDHDDVQQMDRQEPTEVLILLEEIMRNYRLNMLLVSMFITMFRSNERSRKRGGRVTQEVMIDSIPAHVKQLDRLVRVSDRSCIDNLRMDRNTFGRLCRILRDPAGLIDQKCVTVEEQVAIFLSILAHHKKTRVVGHDFMRSSETVSKYTHMVLRGVLTLHEIMLVKPNPVGDDCTDSRWKWFKGCLGALDGTYIPVRVPIVDTPRYRNRKGQVSTNTLAVCDRQLRFVYVLPGWEGSAGDSRILRDAISRPLGLKVPKDCYYLCDSAYANSEGFITPYKGVRYHLKEWGQGSQAPQTAIELFNLKHSKARNVIECSFAVLKMRWGILRSPSFYPIEVQTGLIIACFLLHNFIRTNMEVDPYDELVGVELQDGYGSDHDDPVLPTINTVAQTPMWTKKRDDLAAAMWAHRASV